MKWPILIVSLILVIPALAQSKRDDPSSAYKYLAQEASREEQAYEHNQYEQILSGSAAFLVGNIGYFTTDSQTLKIAYSGIQTVGILSVGQGIYDYYKPNFDRDLLTLLQKEKLTKGHLAGGFLNILGKEERAKRLSLLYGSGLLTLQYVTNAYLSDISTDIKDIYLFMAGINVIVFNYAYFSRDKYERYLEQTETSWNMSPVLGKDKLMVGFSRKF